MTISRRGFLKVLGLTAAGTLIDTAPLSLLGAEDTGVATMAMGYHRVLYRRPSVIPFVGAQPDWMLINAQVVGSIQSTFPTGSTVLMERVRDSSVSRMVWKGLEPPSKDDLHLAFWRASRKLRGDFAEYSRERLMQVPEHLRPLTKLVTVVQNPIHLRNAICEDGIEVALECETELMLSTDLDGWEVYSEFGELPIDPPSELDMGMLLEADKQIVTQSGSLFRKFIKGGGRQGPARNG